MDRNNMIKSKLLITLALSSLLGATSSIALAETKPVGSGPNPFTDCGIGAALFPSTHWAAVSSNVIWDVGSTAVTSATASPETCTNKNVQTAQFVLDTYDNLLEESSKGAGEHLTAVFNMMGCESTDQTVAISSLRSFAAQAVNVEKYDQQTKTQKAAYFYQAARLSSQHCSA